MRVAIVSTVDERRGTARVVFTDRSDTVSAELHVLKNAWPVKPGERVACALLPTGSNGFVLGAYYSGGDPPPPLEEQ